MSTKNLKQRIIRLEKMFIKQGERVRKTISVPADMIDYYADLKKRGVKVSKVINDYLKNTDDYKQYIKRQKK